VYTHGRIRVLKKYQSGIIHRKLKVLLLVIFSQSLIQYTCWACSGASRCSWASPQGDTRGMLDYRLDFWGNICAPRQGLRGPHAGRYIMIIDLGGTSRGNRASTSYMQSAGCGGPSSCLLRQSHTIFLVRIHRLSTKIFSFNSFESLRVLNSVLVVNAY
jgi:hypothetical protein